MIHNTLQRSIACAVVSLALLTVPLHASKNCCKSFGSLLVKCGLRTGFLSVNNNVNIGGTLTVNGTISSTSGSLGDLIAYGNWVYTSGGVTLIAAGDPIGFITNTASLNITLDVTGFIFTVNTAGVYVVMYQVIGSADAPGTSITLQRSTGGGAFTPVIGGTIDVPFPSGDDGTIGEVTNLVIVTGVAAGDQFRLINNSTNLILDTNNGGNGAAITFLRIHS
jgi:hypothetical protein